MGKSVVISGATGYVGAHLCQRFLDEGWRVLALVRTQPSAEATLEGVEYSQSENQLSLWCGKEVPVWVNLVGCTKGGKDVLKEANDTAQKPLADMAARLGAHVIHFSSINVFLGECDPYGASKQEGEAVWEERILPEQLCLLRPGLIYGGAGDTRLAGLYHKMRKWRIIPRIAHGKLAPLYLSDLSDLVCDVAQSKRAGRIVPIGAEEVTYSDFVSKWSRTTGAGAAELTVPKILATSLAAVVGALPLVSGIGRKLGSLQRDRVVSGWGEIFRGATPLTEGLHQTWNALQADENAHA